MGRELKGLGLGLGFLLPRPPFGSLRSPIYIFLSRSNHRRPLFFFSCSGYFSSELRVVQYANQ